MPDPLETVNEVARLHLKWETSARNEGNLPLAAKHAERAEAIRLLVAEVKDRRRAMMPVPASYGDISDLPDELLRQLSGVKTDELEDQIYAIVKAADPEIELDRLLIELFRRFGGVHERRFINNKCYRMAQKGLIYQVPGRKGIYTTTPPEPQYDDEPASAPAKASDFSNLDDEIPF